MPKNESIFEFKFVYFFSIFGILALIDGCITGASKNCTAKVKIHYLEEDEGQFNCRGAKIKVFEDTIQINKHEEEYGMSGASPFTFVMEFKNRICWNLMQSHTPHRFDYIKLTLSGDCGRAKFGLPNLIAYKGRVQELRGVQLDLKNRKVTQWHNPFEPIDGHEPERKKKSNYQWQSTDLDMIDEYGHQKILSDIEKEARMNESDYD